jgi:hypoxanthine phosphoribosyltransferase
VLSHRVLFDEQVIAARVTELAKEISRDLPDRAPLMIGLLTGGFVFLADLIRAGARFGLEPQIDFMAVSHYGSGTEAKGKATIYKDTAFDLRGRAVLVVDDILDSGYTLGAVRDHLATREPRWLRACVLLDKPARRCVDIQADFVGFTVPDVWVIGYGLDAGGQGRALPYVGALEGAPTIRA